MDPQNQATGLTLLRNLQEVRAKDKYTVEIVLKQAQAAFLVQVSGIQPFVVVPNFSIAAGKFNLSAFLPAPVLLFTRIISSRAS